MSVPFPVQHTFESLFVMSVQIKPLRSIPGTPVGERMIFDVVSGSFEGPRLRGQVITGGDWVTRAPSGSRLSVRLLLETHDEVSILFEYSGKASQNGTRVRIEVAGTFDAPAGAYEWLNDVQAFGSGAHGPDGVRYHFYYFG